MTPKNQEIAWVVRQRMPDRYRELINYLASGSWQEADQETDQLMHRAVNREVGTKPLLTVEVIRTFPCEDLHLINKLWMKFSGGKFGICVQKQIWTELGGNLSFSEDIGAMEEVNQKMSVSTGWRAGQAGQMIHYPKMDFDKLPAGHFPRNCICGGAFGSGILLSQLMSRFAECSK
jgi:hypothetical protein